MTDRELDALRAVHPPHRRSAGPTTAGPTTTGPTTTRRPTGITNRSTGLRPRRTRTAWSPRNLLILAVVAAAGIVWVMVRSDSQPVVPTAGLSQASVTVSTDVTRTMTVDSKSALLIAAAVDTLPQSPRSGPSSCGMDQGYTDTVVFDANDPTTVVIDRGGCLTVTVSRGSEQWVLDDSSGRAAAAVDQALRAPAK